MKGKGKNEMRDSGVVQPKNEQLERHLDFYQNSIEMADGAIESICEKASEVLYEEYLRPKCKPYQIKSRGQTVLEATHQYYLPGQKLHKLDAEGIVEDMEPFTPPVELFVPGQPKHKYRPRSPNDFDDSDTDGIAILSSKNINLSGWETTKIDQPIPKSIP